MKYGKAKAGRTEHMTSIGGVRKLNTMRPTSRPMPLKETITRGPLGKSTYNGL
ncbi:hypothetical protein QTL95_17265 [Rhizobium sp. S152]|nr:hypothetical protein [Rhizobium sp. S152]MDM9627654.1 hypothetical protein [Rhizobium sp. S152]